MRFFVLCYIGRPVSRLNCKTTSNTAEGEGMIRITRALGTLMVVVAFLAAAVLLLQHTRSVRRASGFVQTPKDRAIHFRRTGEPLATYGG